MVEADTSNAAQIEPLEDRLARFLKREIDVGSFPGASYAVGSSKALIVHNALGYSALKPAKIKADVDTVYDVASLTKPLITATLVLKLFADGKLNLEDRVSQHLSELKGTDKESLTFVDLLTHRGGFQAWYPLYTQGMGDEAYLKAILRRPLRYRPGTREIYSCLGFILLKVAIQKISGLKAGELARQLIFAPLGLDKATFNPAPEMKYRIAATEWGNANERQMVATRGIPFPHFRNYMIWGEVNDGNAYYMGGVGGNAGLFATASEVFQIARSYLDKKEVVLPQDVIHRSLRNYTVGLAENRGLGWQLQTTREDHPSAVFSPYCYGHTGFSGTSVWVDPARDLVAVLLTNRLHPNAKPVNMQRIRRDFHRIIVEEWE